MQEVRNKKISTKRKKNIINEGEFVVIDGEWILIKPENKKV